MKIAICDDNPYFIEEILKKHLSKVADRLKVEFEIFTFTKGNRLIKEFKSGFFCDLVILDIDMPEINGKEVAKELRVMDSSFNLVFVTAYKQEVYNVFQFHVDAFISKDSSEERFQSELSRVIGLVIGRKEDSSCSYEWFDILDEFKRKCKLKLYVQDIFYFSCGDKTVHLHTGTKKYLLIGRTLEKFKTTYSVKGFYEPCRGFLVNINHISGIKKDEIILDNNEWIPLSRRKKNELLDILRDMLEREAL